MKNIILIGFKGVGKTKWAKILSAHLNREMIDTDRLIVEYFAVKNGEDAAVHEIYDFLGEIQFRELEKKVICSLCPKNSIIATGGGSILDPQNVAHLKTLGTVVYLEEDLKIVQERFCQMSRHLNFININQRKPLYQAAADKTLNLTNKTEQEILENLLSFCTQI